MIVYVLVALIYINEFRTSEKLYEYKTMAACVEAGNLVRTVQDRSLITYVCLRVKKPK